MSDLDYPSMLVHDNDEAPSTLIRFMPDHDDSERILFSSPRFELNDEEGEVFETSGDEEDIYQQRDKARMDHDLATIDEYGITATEEEEDEPRFTVSDCMDRDEVPDWFTDGSFGTHYHHSDGWRGYSVVDYDHDIWEEFAGGWVTGFPDEATSHKMSAAELHNELYAGNITPPFPIVWFFGVTSNVFSMSSDILIPAGKSEEFETWINQVNGFDDEEIRHAFN